MDTYLGFDYGTQSIGVAVGQTTSHTAQALKVVPVKRQGPAWPCLDQLVKEWEPQALVVGLPLHMDRREGSMSRAARRFGEQLAHRYNLPVHWVDERLSSHAAEQALREQNTSLRTRAKRRDAVAAQFILQTFLSEQENGQVEPD